MQLFVRGPNGDGRVRAIDVGDGATATAAQVLEAYVASRQWPLQAAHMLRLVHGGRTLPPASPLRRHGVRAGAALDAAPRLRGGGGDGGSTGAEDRRAFLEMYAGKKAERATPEEARLAAWTTCRLSGAPLAPPCAADELGSLFNRDAVVRALLAKDVPPSLAHITSLKHLVPVRLEAAPGAAAAAAVRFACPVTGLPLDGRARFVVVRPSGVVVAEKAVKEARAVVEELAGGPWEPGALLPVNPAGDELEALAAALAARRAAERGARAHKKQKRGGGKPGAPPAAPAGGGDAAAKRARVEGLKPQGADAAVWNSLFASGSGAAKNDFMLRGSSRVG